MKYKVGDRVRIKDIDWYNENKNEYGDINCPPCMFVWVMCQYCGKILTINSVDDFDKKYKMIEDAGRFNWTDEMIEGLVEEEVGLVDNLSSRWVNEFNLPDGYIFRDENGNVINAQKIVLEKKKKEYPKTYEECCKVLNTDDDSIIDISVPLHYNHLLISFTQLLICRDAYWKIAGEEMGLGKPWEPDWSIYEHKFCLGTDKDKVIEECVTTGNRILAFPTAEMRDAFYENFRELIEICKELL